MLTRLAWLALEVKYLDPAQAFYVETLEMAERSGGSSDEVVLAAGDTDLILRRPSAVPRGGLHTHFAFSIPSDEYDGWWDSLDGEFDLEEFVFGHARSLYLYDPDGNCVELGQRDVEGPGIDGIFEVVLEVESLERAESFYGALGFETVDRGAGRNRIRMAGPMALELWEPHLGIADARGGVHVDLGFETDDLDGILEVLEDRACTLERLEDESGTETVVARDPDGHHLTFLE